MAKVDPQVLRHKEWLGLLQPVGLVVAPVALVKGQAVPSKNVTEQQRTLIEVTGGSEVKPILSFERFALEVLEWQSEDLVGAGDTEVPSDLDVALTEYREVLSPTFAVPDPAEDGKWLLLVKEVEDELDRATDASKQGWHTSPQVRFERLLRDNEVPIGILANAENVRLVYAPTGESSGHLTFPVSAMREVAGRPILAALLMLLGSDRLFTLPDDRRLPTLLSESRKYQNVVSTELSQQVLRALGELLRGFQAADNAMNGDLLNDAMREDPQHVYGGLITVLMRLVFLLYAEERDLLPGDDVYQEHYSVTGLFEKLRSDAALYPDTMDQRYGAWARLLSLFRLIFDGGQHGTMSLPARQGQLFHPDEYPFLEGRPYRSVRQLDELLSPPRVSDGTIYRVLEDLLVLDGERLSYRTLDVEQIGSVYEAIMGFEVKRAMAPSIAVRPEHVVVNLQQILDAKPGQRSKILLTEANCGVPRGALKNLKAATTPDELVEALASRISPQTPTTLPAGALFLQPTQERRRSGSHYSPRSLTEPTVRTTLRPLLEDLGTRPRAEQILQLKVCDPAMGSGAFLVEACRHLADKVVAAWAAHDATPEIPPDEDAVLHARRLVAQRCLYGVDSNRFAVGLARLSLWLVTLAKDHAFTFIDHSLKHGDSLVGASRRQVAAFHWETTDDHDLPLLKWMTEQIGQVTQARESIPALDDEDDDGKRRLYRHAEDAVEDARLTGNAMLSAFFAADTARQREQHRRQASDLVETWRRTGASRISLVDMVSQLEPVVPFHWEIEFPEVFGRANPGFDAFVGNPPFMMGRNISTNLGRRYLNWLQLTTPGAGGQADLVAYFFRRAFALLREGGCLGLISTNTISQGDTRTAGLTWIRHNDGTIFAATKRARWPGSAAVLVSVVHVAKRRAVETSLLDGAPVEKITAFLAARGGDDSPLPLKQNAGLCFKGPMVYGSGFLFDDADANASSLDEMEELVARHPEARECISPYLGGSEMLGDPQHLHTRYAIGFGDLALDEVRQRWPALLSIVEQKVKPERLKLRDNADGRRRKKHWWLWGRTTPGLDTAKAGLSRVLMHPFPSNHMAFAFIPATTTISAPHCVFVLEDYGSFGVLQSRPHEVWVRTFASSLKDDLRYTPTDAFQTFPSPTPFPCDRPDLDQAGQRYYEFRAALMQANGEGLTKTYNRFHDPEEASDGIHELRTLHDAMDRAVLDSYGWSDIRPACEFLLDFEEADTDESSRRKKPWRYRWPDELQEEILARLLDLNEKRVKAESGTKRRPRSRKVTEAGPVAAHAVTSKPLQKNTEGKPGRSSKKKKKRSPSPSDSQIQMFTEDIE